MKWVLQYLLKTVDIDLIFERDDTCDQYVIRFVDLTLRKFDCVFKRIWKQCNFFQREVSRWDGHIRQDGDLLYFVLYANPTSVKK